MKGFNSPINLALRTKNIPDFPYIIIHPSGSSGVKTVFDSTYMPLSAVHESNGLNYKYLHTRLNGDIIGFGHGPVRAIWEKKNGSQSFIKIHSGTEQQLGYDAASDKVWILKKNGLAVLGIQGEETSNLPSLPLAFETTLPRYIPQWDAYVTAVDKVLYLARLHDKEWIKIDAPRLKSWHGLEKAHVYQDTDQNVLIIHHFHNVLVFDLDRPPETSLLYHSFGEVMQDLNTGDVLAYLGIAKPINRVLARMRHGDLFRAIPKRQLYRVTRMGLQAVLGDALVLKEREQPFLTRLKHPYKLLVGDDLGYLDYTKIGLIRRPELSRERFSGQVLIQHALNRDIIVSNLGSFLVNPDLTMDLIEIDYDRFQRNGWRWVDAPQHGGVFAYKVGGALLFTKNFENIQVVSTGEDIETANIKSRLPDQEATLIVGRKSLYLAEHCD